MHRLLLLPPHRRGMAGMRSCLSLLGWMSIACILLVAMPVVLSNQQRTEACGPCEVMSALKVLRVTATMLSVRQTDLPISERSMALNEQHRNTSPQ